VKAIARRLARLEGRLIPQEDPEAKRLAELLRKRPPGAAGRGTGAQGPAAAYHQRAPLDGGRHSAPRPHSRKGRGSMEAASLKTMTMYNLASR
jgi:hypothetical protein